MKNEPLRQGVSCLGRSIPRKFGAGWDKQIPVALFGEPWAYEGERRRGDEAVT